MKNNNIDLEFLSEEQYLVLLNILDITVGTNCNTPFSILDKLQVLDWVYIAKALDMKAAIKIYGRYEDSNLVITDNRTFYIVDEFNNTHDLAEMFHSYIFDFRQIEDTTLTDLPVSFQEKYRNFIDNIEDPDVLSAMIQYDKYSTDLYEISQMLIDIHIKSMDVHSPKYWVNEQ